MFKLLTKKYYSGLLDFLNDGYLTEEEYQNERFYEIDLLDCLFNYLNTFDRNLFRCFERGMFCKYRLKLILPFKIKEFAKNGLDKGIEPFLFKTDIYKNDRDNKVYIDNDRIGLKIK